MNKLFKKGHNLSGHIMIGLAVLVILWFLNNKKNWITIQKENIIILIIIGIIYSLLPDIDQPGAIINKYATIGLVAIVLYSFYTPQYKQYGIIAIVILGLLRVIEHRTLIHSVGGAIIIAAPLLYFGFIYFLVGFIAFISHIISDNDFSIWTEKDWKLGR